jgi:hypothetical protein
MKKRNRYSLEFYRPFSPLVVSIQRVGGKSKAPHQSMDDSSDSGNPRVCTRRVWVQVHFGSCDLNPTRAEPNLSACFIFHPQVQLNPKETKKPPKESEKNSKETYLQNLMDPNPIQNPTGSGAKFHS